MSEISEIYKVLIVDDEQLAREGLIYKIDWLKNGFSLAGEAKNGKEAIEKIKRLEPDLVITDISMPEMDGLELLRYVREQMEKQPQFIIVTGYGTFDYAREAIRYKATEYVMKPIFRSELVEALQKVRENLDQQRLYIQSTLSVDEMKKIWLNHTDIGKVEVDLREKISEYVEMHYRENIGIDDMAFALGYNGGYLGKILKKSFNMSFRQYLNQIRMDKAKEYLLEGKYTLEEIAEKTGFSNADYFGKKFREMFGITPSEYRKSTSV